MPESPTGGGQDLVQEGETGRLAAFSDGVMAVIITIMALELKAPAGGTFRDLRARLPSLWIYMLSFAFIGIYWNNHHHLLRTATRVTGRVMWANLHLLFWLSLIPVLTEWIGEDYHRPAPAMTYAIVALGSGLAYYLLSRAIIRAEGRHSVLARAVGRDIKSMVSLGAYVAAVPLAHLSPWISYGCFAGVAIMWFVPDRRLSRL